MSTQIDLKSTERNSFKLAAYGDGLNDISLGLGMATLSLYPVTRAALGLTGNLIFLFAVLSLILWLQFRFKNKLTSERLGLVKLGEKGLQRLKFAVLIIAVLFFLTTLTWVLISRGYFLPSAWKAASWLSSYGFDLMIGFSVLTIFSAVAYSLNLTRFYLYALLLGFSFPLQAILDKNGWLPLLTSGLIITASGIFHLFRFLKNFPPVDEGEVGHD